ncbi:MAG: tyrosine-protein phosphatase [Pseudomonadales bacterium]
MKNDPLHCRNVHMLALQGIENFRDIGGYQTSDGRSLKWGKVFRCGHLMQMTAMDGESLNSLAINGIFDLRTEMERDSFPTAWRCSLQPEIFTIDVHGPDEDPKADLFQLILAGKISSDDVHAHMLADYARMPFQFAPILKKLCDHLITSQDATAVIHCTAGKDRTGLIIALLQAVLGVSVESIYEDYLLSNEGFSSREKLEHMVATFGHKVEHIDLCMDALRPLITVDKVYLNAALGAIDETFGSVQNYFETTLDISADQQQMLRDNLLKTA